VEIVPVTLMGLIAPVTLVGAAVFHTADVLAGITMAQIIRPGAPVLFGGAPAAFHMKATTAPMTAVEALRLDAAYVAVAKSLGVPSQAYMALSDSKFLDAQAGAETSGSALLAALAGVNSVSGPGMLDYVLVFSLAKLIFDDEICGQALAFVRDTKVVEDLPALDLARILLDEQHLLTAEHTLAHWPQELYLPGSVIDRDNRDNWTKAGRPTLEKRAYDDVERRLAAYEPPETDARIDVEMRRLIQAGMAEEQDLPPIPPLPQKPRQDDAAAKRARRPRPRRPTTPPST
jgi:trimethylamine--corrinoid protein Co-methyltransferase